MSILIPILTFIVGLALGGYGAYQLFKRQMSTMQNDPKQIQAIAKSMGVNLNQKQLNRVSKQMQPGKKKPEQKKKK